MTGRRIGRPALVALFLVVAVPLFGCNLFAGMTDSDDRIAEKRIEKWLASQGVTQAPTQTDSKAAEPAPKADLTGTWTGALTFTKFEMHLEDEAAAALEDDIAPTMNKDYPIKIEVKTDGGGAKTTVLTFGDNLTIPGSFKDEADEFVMVFKKKGDQELAVGSSPPVAFTLRGFIDKSNVMRGKVLYEVFQANGEPGWDQTGSWEAVRR